MKTLFLTKLLAAITISAGAMLTCPTAAYADDMSKIELRLDYLEKRINLLDMEEIVYNPITVSHIHLGSSKRFIAALPGQKIPCSFHYKLDSSQQEFLLKNHLLVGLQGVSAEGCATHLYGVWDSTGVAKFDLLAPLAEGDYDVRIAYLPGDTCQDALNAWNVLGNEPSDYATIGILRVRNAPVSP